MTIENASAPVAYVTSGTGLATGIMSANELLAYMSIFFLVLTYATNLYFKIRQERRMKRAEAAGKLVEVSADVD